MHDTTAELRVHVGRRRHLRVDKATFLSFNSRQLPTYYDQVIEGHDGHRGQIAICFGPEITAWPPNMHAMHQ